MREYRGTLEGQGLRVAIAVSRYNESVTRGLLEGALAALAECGVPPGAVGVAHVPGALELPVVARELALAGRWDAVVALGAVIRGETDHYAYVCAESARGCAAVALETGVPVAFGVLTCETLAQARDRSTTPSKNKGGEAARSAVETANLLRSLRRDAPADAPGPASGVAPARGDERADGAPRGARRGALPRGAKPRGAIPRGANPRGAIQ